MNLLKGALSAAVLLGLSAGLTLTANTGGAASSHGMTGSIAAQANVHHLPNIPAVRTDDGHWMEKHHRLVGLVRSSQPEIAFVGDSLTDCMSDEVLHKYIGNSASKYAVCGDRTQNLLWRMKHGELDFSGAGPKLFVVQIGTNNISEWAVDPQLSGKEITEGVKANLNEIRTRFPNTKILLVAILPRAEKPTSIARARVDETNQYLKDLADNNHIWYTDVNSVLLEKDGRISEEIMSDYWHPTDKGYEKMLTAMKPSIDKLLIAEAK